MPATAASIRSALIMLALLLSSCASQSPAMVEDHRHDFFGRDGKSYASRRTPSKMDRYTPSPAELAIPTAQAAPVPSISAKEVPTETFRTRPLPPESKSTPAAAIEKTVTTQTSSDRFIWPVEGRILSSFGHKTKGISQDGITLAAPLGTPIHASADGTVVYAGNKLKTYGNMVILRHDSGMTTTYAHAAELRVRPGQKIRIGDTIALVGSSGSAMSPQLFFAIRENDTPMDPIAILPARTQTLALTE